MSEKERAALIHFGLRRLSDLNGGHRFEALSEDFAKKVLEPDLLPATGPVGAGGDRGRDFETFGDARAVFVCTTKHDGLPSKLRHDVRSALSRGRSIRRVYVFLTASLQVRQRNDLRDELEAEHGIEVEIFDGLALAERLASPDLLEIPEEHLGIPLLRQMEATRMPHSLGPAGEVDATMVGGAATGTPIAGHVQRDVEGELREAFERALSEPGTSLVMAEGERCSGRSFAVARALATAAPALPVHVANTAEELWTWLGLGHAEAAALLLDPFDRIVEEGGIGLIDDQRGQDRWRPSLLLVGIAEPLGLGQLERLSTRADAAIEVDTMLTPHELERAGELLERAGIRTEVEQWGLGPTLVGGPRLADRYRRAAGAAGPGREGRRLLETVVGWRQAGFREELDEGTLQALYTAAHFNSADSQAAAQAWERGVQWALEEAAPGQTAVRIEGGGWTAHPALAELPLPHDWRERWLGDSTWSVLESWAGGDPGRLASAGTAAGRLGDHERAASTLQQAIRRGSSRARLNLALIWLREGPAKAGSARELLAELREDLREPARENPAARRALALTLRTLGRLDHEKAPRQAATVYCDAALLGDAEAAVNLAQLERMAGRETIGLEMLRSAARQGSVIAAAALMTDFSLPLDQVDDALDDPGVEALGALLLRAGRRNDAQRAFEKAAAAGRLQAGAQLGGLLLERDPDRAIEVLEPAVARGSRAATLYLGRALGERQPERARRLLRRC